TPLELTVLYAALANNGKIVKPTLLSEIRDPDTGRLLRKVNPQIQQTLNLSLEHLRVVQEGLRAVIYTGTGRYLNQPGLVPAAGKTGTVQTRSGRKGIDHAWFAGYAPYDDEHIKDRVVVVVFVEHGRAGSASAVPIAADVLRAVFPDWKDSLPVPTIPGYTNSVEQPLPEVSEPILSPEIQ
ncbi:MAG: penicillin-binding protein 2, partial [Leptonema sp. (in: Bacteria)]|nr:penicillin-binding protein 2 [Leptonema sp. (in: bacteria)]